MTNGANARVLHKAVFLDRDGVINRDHGYVACPADFEFIPGVEEALKQLSDAGFLLVVVTNQSGIARGYFTESDFERLTAYMRALLSKRGISLAGVYHCPHHPDFRPAECGDPCRCRKPLPGMILDAARDLDIDLARSILIGDNLSDIAAGRAAKVALNLLVGSDDEARPDKGLAPDGKFIDLRTCVGWLARQGLLAVEA